MLLNFRQGVFSGHVRQDGVTNFLTSSGNHVSLVSASTKLVLSISHGQTNYLVTIPNSIPNYWTIPIPVQTWLLLVINPVNARVEAKTTRVEPIMSISRPDVISDDQYWFDLNTFKMRVTRNGVWCETIGVVVGRWDANSSVECVQLGSQIGYSTPALAGSIVFDEFGKPMKKSSGEFFTTEDQAFSQTSVASSQSSTTITATAMTTIAKDSIVKLVEWGQILPASTTDIGKYVIGFIRTEAVAGSEVLVVLSGKITSVDWNWSYPNEVVWASINGQVTTVQTTDRMSSFRVLPVGRVIDYNTILFAPPITENVGLRGIPGPVGLTGAQGLRGEQGIQGLQGIQGQIGVVGPPGDRGQTGPIGPVGPQGLQGTQGPAGIQGERGPKGDSGEVGPQGIRGIQGERGPKGDKGDPGPKGDKGDPGPMGPIGRTGPIGLQGTTGATGSNGLSAYEVAVQQGYTGTVTEWLNSLSQPSTSRPKSRTVVSGTTTSIAPGASEVIPISGFSCYTLLRVTTTSPAYVRIYCSADTAIVGNSAPVPAVRADNDGLIWHGDLTSMLTQITPAVVGYNNETADSTTMYVSVTNKSGVSKRVTVGMTIIKNE